MTNTGIPDFLRIPQDRRNVNWLANPPHAGRAFDIKHIRADEASVAEFKRQAEEERRIASLNRIAKMKTKLASGKIDPKTHRWDQRRAKFVPLEPWALKKPAPVAQRSEPAAHNGLVAGSNPAGGTINKDNCEQIAKLNGIWKDSYSALTPGLMVMTVKGRLKRLVNVQYV